MRPLLLGPLSWNRGFPPANGPEIQFTSQSVAGNENAGGTPAVPVIAALVSWRSVDPYAGSRATEE